MSKLLRSGLARLRKSRIFWVGMAAQLLYCAVSFWAVYDGIKKYGAEVDYTVDEVLFLPAAILGLVLCVVCSLFIGQEYSDGTLRNKIVMGHSRFHIYVSSFILCAAAGLMIYTADMLVSIVLARLILGPVTIPGSLLLTKILAGIFWCISYSAVFNFLAMLVTSRAYGVAASIFLAFGLLFFASYLYNSLIQPEMIEQPKEFAVDEHTEISVYGDIEAWEFETVPNPNYISGTQRAVYQVLADLNPAGQSMQISEADAMHAVRMIGYSVLLILIVNFAGIWLFQRKDIK
ncbi:MAG: ABC transporter permease subunit [Lachnospiraceae bacterium]|nr:ABC transporter permease subunit [Lachnospiraceae bacterium]